MPFYSTVTVTAPRRDVEIKRVKEMGPGRVYVEYTTPLPNGFLAVGLVHVNKRGQRVGYTTIVTQPESEGSFTIDC